MIRQILVSSTERAARDMPHKPAVIDDHGPMSYLELTRTARSLASAIPQDARHVVLLLDNGSRAIAAMLACMIRSVPYTPISPSEPLDRRQLMLDSLSCDLIIDAPKLSPPSEPPNTRVLKTLDCGLRISLLGRPQRLTDSTTPSLDDCVYALFTSGSTGRPKGVAIAESNLQPFLEWAQSYFELSSSDVFFNHSRITFDLSVFDIFSSLLAAGTCVTTSSPRDLAFPGEVMQKNGVTIALMVPSVARFMSEGGQLETTKLHHLRHLLFCGEPLPSRYVIPFFNQYPHLKIHNLYGPTEATVACTIHSMDVNTPPQSDWVPIGQGFGTNSAFIGESSDSVDAKGELILRGPQVSTLGYLHADANENARFTTRNGERHYRTGDLVRLDSEGCLHWLARIDEQIKHLGYRIEPGEIESVLLRCPYVSAAVVIQGPKDEGLIAIYVPRKESDGAPEKADLTPEKIEKSLDTLCAQSLPRYMWPSSYRSLPAFPTTRNGKTDRNALRAMVIERDS